HFLNIRKLIKFPVSFRKSKRLFAYYFYFCIVCTRFTLEKRRGESDGKRGKLFSILPIWTCPYLAVSSRFIYIYFYCLSLSFFHWSHHFLYSSSLRKFY